MGRGRRRRGDLRLSLMITDRAKSDRGGRGGGGTEKGEGTGQENAISRCRREVLLTHSLT